MFKCGKCSTETAMVYIKGLCASCSAIAASCGGGLKERPVLQKFVAAATGQQVGGTHYTGLTIQPAEYCHKNGLGYCESAAVKYISRHRAKNGRQDVEKAIHCLQLLLELEYGGES